MLSMLLLYLVVLFAGVVVTSVIGKLVLSLIGWSGSSSAYANFAAAQITGISIVTIATAVYYTHGSTVLLVLLPVFFFAWWELQRMGDLSFADSFGKRLRSHITAASPLLIAEIAVVLVLAFLWQAYSFIDFKTGVPVPCNADIHIVSFASNIMTASGIERNYIFDVPGTIASVPTPYHYFEYWFLILFSKVMGGTPIYSLKLQQIPVFIAVLYALVCTLATSMQVKLNYVLKLLAITLVFFATPLFLVWRTPVVSSAIAGEPLLYKSIHLTWIIFIVLLTTLQRKYSLAIIALLSYVVVCYTALPVIFGTVFIFLAAGILTKIIWKNKPGILSEVYGTFTLRQLYTLVSYMVSVLAGLILFYKLASQNVPKSDLFPYLYSEQYSLSKVIEHFKLKLVAYYALSMTALVELLVVGIVIYYFSYKKNKVNIGTPEIIFFILFEVQYALSIACHSLFSYDYNGFVLARITNLPFLLVLFTYLAFKWYRDFAHTPVLKYTIAGCMLAISVTAMSKSIQFDGERKQYLCGAGEKDYRDKLMHMIGNAGTVGVFMKSEERLTKDNYRMEYDDYYTNTLLMQIINHPIYRLGIYLDYYIPNVMMHPITLTPQADSGFYFPNSVIDNINKSYFYTLYKEHVLKNDTLSETDKRIAFIRYTKAGFLIASKYATIDPALYRLFTDSVTNSSTGERCYLLRP